MTALAADGLDLPQLRARLWGEQPQPGELMTVPPEAVAAPAGSAAAASLAPRTPVPAAVLVAVIHGASPGVLLTKRTTTLSTHAGQVAFPGGRIDPGDASAEDAALREAWEEVGLRAADVELAGRLPDYVTGTGFVVTPVLGLLPDGLDYTPQPSEVEAIFLLPLSVLLDPSAPERRTAELRGRMRTFWVWPHPDHYIWGATAAILVDLAHRLRARELP